MTAEEQVGLNRTTLPVALLAGASRGLGLLLARELRSRGYHVVLTARDAGELDRAAADVGTEVSTRVLDVADRDAVHRCVQAVEDRVGPVEVAVHVAGIIQVGPAADMTLDHFDEAIDIMARGPVNLAWAVLPPMRRRGRGRIGVVSSIGGIVSAPHLLPYSTAKFAAVGFTDGLAAALTGTGVSATTIVPGLMRTGSQDRAFFTGNVEAEHNWFAVAASLPLVSVGGARAARRIVDGVLAGRPLVTLTPATWLAYRTRGLAPATLTRILGAAGSMLPNPTGNTVATPGTEVRQPAAVRLLTVLGRRAAARNNER